MHGPTHLTILPTYRCTAACAQCCFESNPHVQGRIPLPRILDYIDQAAGEFPTLRLVVFSGGATKGDESVYEDARAIFEGGGNGSIIGRNAFQRPREEALEMLDKIMQIYLGKDV